MSFEILSSKNQVKTERIEMTEGIKKRLFEDMKIGEKMIKRNEIQEKIIKERETKGIKYPAEIEIGRKIEKIKEGSKYKDILQQYREIKDNMPANEIKLRNLDKQLAEQMILNSSNMIEFDPQEQYESGKTAEQESLECYERLDKIGKFHGKIELIKKISKNESFFVIKRTKKQLDKIESDMKVYDEVPKDKEKMESGKEEKGDKEITKETQKENVVTLAKTRLQQTINRYIEKIKKFKNADKSQKEQLTKEIEAVKEELKKVKEEYENVKNNLFGKIDYKPEEFKRMSTRRIRWVKKQEENGVITGSHIERLRMTNIKRRMTINRLIKKFNKIGDKSTDGVRFIMGFEKTRFLRYTGAMIYTKVDKLGSNLGLQMSPEQFHSQFNIGRDNIFAVLDKGEKTDAEQKIIDKLKERINYYGHAYAKERTTARTKPFVEAEKKSTQKKTEPEPKNTGELTDEELARRKKEIEEELEKRNKKTK